MSVPPEQQRDYCPEKTGMKSSETSEPLAPRNVVQSVVKDLGITSEMLLCFCAGPDDLREYLQAPWREGGVIFATNGHFLIEIPDDGREVVSKGRHPNAGAMFTKYPPGEFVEFPPLAPPSLQTGQCIECMGTGLYRNEYSENKAEQRCYDCSGFGEVGYLPRAHWTEVGGVAYQTRYLRLFATLPNARIAPVPDMGANVIFDGGRGIVMPRRDDPPALHAKPESVKAPDVASAPRPDKAEGQGLASSAGGEE